MSRPIGPPPMTTAVSPGARSPRRTSWHGDRQRLGERAEAQVDAGRKAVQRERRNGPRGLQRTGRVDAEELQVVADVAEPAIGGRLAARVERAHDNRVAGAKAGDSLADLGDRPRHLVADHLRGMHAGVHRPVRDVQVGPAHAAVGDVEAHLVGARLLDGCLADREAAAAVVIDRVHRTII